MQPETQSPLPRLNLTPPQQQILLAHLQVAVSGMVQMRFSQEKQLDNMLNHSFFAGQTTLIEELLNFDKNQEERALAAAQGDNDGNV